MIILRQTDFVNKHKLNTLLNNMKNTELHFNFDSLDYDIDRLTKEMGVEKNKTRQHNIKVAIDYLTGIKRKYSDKSALISWFYCDDCVKSVPIQIKHIAMFDLSATDYLETHGRKMLYLDYTELMDIIAFDIIHKDLYVTKEEIESELSDYGILIPYEAKHLREFTGKHEEQPYRVGQLMRVQTSAYFDYENGNMLSYFGKKFKSHKDYREVIESSCRDAISLILSSILPKAINLDCDVRLCEVQNTGIMFSYKEDTLTDVASELRDDVAIRSFGRLWAVTPKVTLY